MAKLIMKLADDDRRRTVKRDDKRDKKRAADREAVENWKWRDRLKTQIKAVKSARCVVIVTKSGEPVILSGADCDDAIRALSLRWGLRLIHDGGKKYRAPRGKDS